MAKSQDTTAVEVKITPENQAQIALAILQRNRQRNEGAIKFWTRLAAKQRAARA